MLCTLPASAEAAPDDDWSLSRDKDDPTLVHQRLGKLRRTPFDTRQWNALRQAMGLGGMAKKLRAELSRNPGDVALRILDARLMLAEDKPAAAARALDSVEADAGRWRDEVFALRIEALEQARDFSTAAAELESRAQAQSKDKTRIELLERAYGLAERGHRNEQALRIAQKLAAFSPDDMQTRLRLARAAAAAGEPALADRAYADAIERARGSNDELVAERARARLDADNPSGAAALLWSLLEAPRRGTRAAREVWWEQLAASHRQSRTTDVLIRKLSTWLQTHEREAAAWRTLAEAQESAGIDPTPAWRHALALAPRDEATHARLIEALEAKGDIDGAVEAYRRLLARSPREIEPGLELANRLMASNDRDLGMKLASEIEGRVGRWPHGLMLLLDFYNLNDEPELALQMAQRLVKASPRNPDARVALGEQLYQMNRTHEALEQWAKLPRLIHPSHKGWARHAQVLSEHGRTSEAVGSLKHALELEPREPAYLRLRAVLAEEQRRPTQALQLWEHVRLLATREEDKLLRDEARTRVVELLVGGSIPKRRVKLESAHRDAQALLDKGEPLEEAIEAGRFLAELHTRRENYSAAVEVQHRLLELAPHRPERLEDLAAAQRRAGQVKSALGTLEELLEAQPDRSADVLAEMSELAFEAGDDDRALKAATRAARRDRHQVEALVRLGELHERRGDMEAAARAYGRALEDFPTDARARLRLAELELTRGNADRSARLLREVLEQGGPADLLKDAGRRALDLAEASDSLVELFGLAVARARKHPEAEEPREFLLEALERIDPDEIQSWLERGHASDGSDRMDRAEREDGLRRPLVASLSRGSVGARLRAAEHLGRLRLPETAVPMARMAISLSAPRDATLTVRQAYERTRLSAIRAAGSLADPEAVELFVEILNNSRYELSIRQSAAWALARASTASAVQALGEHLRPDTDAQIATWACLAIGTADADAVDPDHAASAAVLARSSRHPHLRHACAFAEAAVTPPKHAERLRSALRSSDPLLAAVAAWRLGRLGPDPAPATIEALLRRFVGPHGLARDASGAALARLLDTTGSRAQRAAPVPPATNDNTWGVVVERWLHAEVAPKYAAVEPEAMAPHREALARALAAAASGTRGERAAARRVREDCDGPPGSVCLQPLLIGPVLLLADD